MTRLHLVTSTGGVHRARSSAAPNLRLVSNTGSRYHPRPSPEATPRRHSWLSLAVGFGALAASALVAIGGYTSSPADIGLDPSVYHGVQLLGTDAVRQPN